LDDYDGAEIKIRKTYGILRPERSEARSRRVPPKSGSTTLVPRGYWPYVAFPISRRYCIPSHEIFDTAEYAEVNASSKLGATAVTPRTRPPEVRNSPVSFRAVAE